ncbi:MAG TPA: hypothetical protein VHG27_03845 [Xanthobacteraceae bacterium]|nr:hypothetical protein [Xanthobacteraceae bacterium]
MSEKIIGLHGTYRPETPAPNETVVQEIERLLEAARSGEIVGLAGSYVHKNNMITYSFAGAISGYAMLGGLECLKERLLRIALSRG